MHQLMNTVLDACEHAELITLIQAYDLQLYLPFGFQVLYERSFYTLDRDDVQRTNNVGCVYDPPALDLLKCYSAYISRFNGFYARDLDYFVSYKKEIAAEGGKVIGYYGQDHQIQAYCTMLLDRQKADVEEIIYLDSLSLIKMINAALQERNTITINVSKAENLSLLFPRAPREDRGSTLVRLNNPELYSRLFNTKVETVQEAFALSEKPLNLSEHF
jgi:predicted acetyltransferase